MVISSFRIPPPLHFVLWHKGSSVYSLWHPQKHYTFLYYFWAGCAKTAHQINGQFKMLQTADRVQNADCRLQTEYKMQTDKKNCFFVRNESTFDFIIITYLLWSYCHVIILQSLAFLGREMYLAFLSWNVHCKWSEKNLVNSFLTSSMRSLYYK